MEVCLKAGAVNEVGEEGNLKGVELNEKKGVELNKKEEGEYLHPESRVEEGGHSPLHVVLTYMEDFFYLHSYCYPLYYYCCYRESCGLLSGSDRHRVRIGGAVYY